MLGVYRCISALPRWKTLDWGNQIAKKIITLQVSQKYGLKRERERERKRAKGCH